MYSPGRIFPNGFFFPYLSFPWLWMMSMWAGLVGENKIRAIQSPHSSNSKWAPFHNIFPWVLFLTLKEKERKFLLMQETFLTGLSTLSSPPIPTTTKYTLKKVARASLVAQWLRICLPMQGSRAQALVREDPTCCGATKPMRHSYWACALEPVSHNYWARVPQLLKPVPLEPELRNKRNHRNEKPEHHNEE